MAPGPQRAGRFDIADIVRAHRPELEEKYRLQPEQKRVLTDIAQCRTEVLGGHLDRCAHCDYEQPSYNSCRNRHCPKCQASAQEKWIEEQRERMLPRGYFHVVFTMPAQLRPLAMFAPRIVYEALLHSAGQTLLEFGHSRLSGTIGATLVLHTWTRDLSYHPHAHALVTAGGLSLDGLNWKKAGRRFLFHIKPMGIFFRGGLITALRNAYRDGHFKGFRDFDDPEAFGHLMSLLGKIGWNIHVKPSFSNAEHVLQYLGRYTHRVGMANSRLVDVTDQQVTFRTKDGHTQTLSPVEFLRRFVRHVLPDGFHKIRHLGLHASRSKREVARTLLDTHPQSAPKKLTWRERFAQLNGREVSACPHCGHPLLCLPLRQARSPPKLAA